MHPKAAPGKTPEYPPLPGKPAGARIRPKLSKVDRTPRGNQPVTSLRLRQTYRSGYKRGI